MRFFLLIFVFFFPVCFIWTEVQADEKALNLFTDSNSAIEGGDVDSAIDYLKKTISLNPNNSEAYETLGYLFLKKGLINEGIDAFSSALKINSDLSTSKTGLGLALIMKNELQKAEEVLKDALQLNPYPSKTHYALGVLYERLFDYKKAIFHFKEGLRTYKPDKKR